MTNYLAIAEGFAMACGVLMAAIAALLWHHHSMRPAWGLRWLSVAMAFAALANLMAPMLDSGLLPVGVSSSGPAYGGVLALIAGFASMAALIVGLQHYVLRPPPRPWLVFLGVLATSLALVLASSALTSLPFVGDLIAVSIFLHGARLSFAAAKQEPGVGHALMGLALLAHPLMLALLAILGVDLRGVRYLSAAPYAIVGLVLLSASLVRIRSALTRELQARAEAEQVALAAQAALRKSHDVQQALLQQAPVPMAYAPVVAGNLPKTFWNQAWYKAFGYAQGSKEGLGGSDFDFFVDPDTRQTYISEVLAQRRAGPFEARLRHASGGEMLCQIKGCLIDSDDGQFVVTSFFDITEQRANELRLREFESMVQSADDALLIFDDSQVTFANSAAARMFCTDVQNLIGKKPEELSPAIQADGRTSAEAAENIANSAFEGIPQRFHWQHCRANGNVFTAQVSLTAIDGAQGRFVAVLRDVTDDLAKAEALGRSEALMRSIIAVSNTGAWKFHQSSSHLWCSPEYFTMLAYDPGDFERDGRSNVQVAWLDLVHSDDREQAGQRFADYVRSGESGLYESYFRMRHADGSWLWIWSRGQRVLNPDNTASDIIVGAHINVTHLRQVQEELRASRDQFQSLIDNLAGTVYRCKNDADWTMLYVSANIDSICGYSAEELIDNAVKAYGQLIHPADSTQVSAEVTAAIASNCPWELEYRILHRDGSCRWVAETGRAVRNERGELLYLDGFITDITQRKRAEEALRLTQFAVDRSADAIFLITPDARFLYVNEAACSALGYSREELTSMTINDIDPDVPNSMANQIFQELKQRGSLRFETRHRRKDGTRVPVEVYANYIAFGGEEYNNCFVRDISERKEAERKLEELNQTLEARVKERTVDLTKVLDDLNRTQQDLVQSEKLAALGALVAGVAHELNTPIGNAVTVTSTLISAHASFREKMASGLSRSALNLFLDRVGEAGDMLSRNLSRAADLVSSFKQVAVDQHNHQRRSFALADILTEVQIIMAPSLRKAHVDLSVDLRDEVSLDSYPGALTQALMILISNAITHAFEGREAGHVSITATAAGADRVHIVVADDGVGIPPGNLGRVFEPFFTTKLGKGGSGLGLHICYNVLTGSLGGKVSAESTLGQGTRMLIDIPLTAPDTLTATSEQA